VENFLHFLHQQMETDSIWQGMFFNKLLLALFCVIVDWFPVVLIDNVDILTSAILLPYVYVKCRVTFTLYVECMWITLNNNNNNNNIKIIIVIDLYSVVGS